jgi:hypothetical protein
MDPIAQLSIGVIFLIVGFLAGYGVRAHISHLRHRRAKEGF